MIRFVFLAIALCLSVTPAHAAWVEASSTHVVVYADGDPDRARKLAEQIERYDAAFRVLRQLPDRDLGPANRLTVFVVGTTGDIARMVGNDDVAGFYIGRAGYSAIFVPGSAGGGRSSPGDLSRQVVLFHEYAHHMMYREMTFGYPTWLSEGFAEFHSTAQLERDGSVTFGAPAEHRAYALLNMTQLPIERLLDPGTKPLTNLETESLYGRGWLLTHYLTFNAKRAGQLRAYLDGLDKGKSSVEAGRAAFGDLKALNAELDHYVQGRFPALKVNADAIHPAPVTVRTLSAGADAMMDVHIASVHGVKPDQAQALLVKARRAAAPFPADADAQGWLAEAELDAGNDTEALAAADRALAADPASRQGLIYRARALLALASAKSDAALREQARAALLAANHRDPDDPVPMMLLYANFTPADPAKRKSYVDAIVYAAELAPEDQTIRMMAGREFLRAGNLRAARLMLSPVAFAPHAPLDNPARKLIEMIDAGDKAGIDRVLNGPEPSADDAKQGG